MDNWLPWNKVINEQLGVFYNSPDLQVSLKEDLLKRLSKQTDGCLFHCTCRRFFFMCHLCIICLFWLDWKRELNVKQRQGECCIVLLRYEAFQSVLWVPCSAVLWGFSFSFTCGRRQNNCHCISSVTPYMIPVLDPSITWFDVITSNHFEGVSFWALFPSNQFVMLPSFTLMLKVFMAKFKLSCIPLGYCMIQLTPNLVLVLFFQNHTEHFSFGHGRLTLQNVCIQQLPSHLDPSQGRCDGLSKPPSHFKAPHTPSKRNPEFLADVVGFLPSPAAPGWLVCLAWADLEACDCGKSCYVLSYLILNHQIEGFLLWTLGRLRWTNLAPMQRD